MDKATVDSLLTNMLELGEGLSDLLFIVGKPPLVEVHGHLREFPIDTAGGVLDGQLVEGLAGYLMAGNDRLAQDFAATGSCDTSYAIDEVARFRVNIFKQNGRHAVVMRKLNSGVPSLEELNLPPVFRDIVQEKNGIVLITGGTGSGKTTTLAALVNELNRTQEIHLVTLEDPIEFLHQHGKAAISQRELGKDFFSFADGLRAALRQAPKAILVGEIRDRDTMEIAMTASETGHLVFSTLHTINAGQTINRIIGLFGSEDEEQVRERLADTLRYIISQRLVPRLPEGRLLITEILGHGLRTREAILYGERENCTFGDIIEAGGSRGWHSFDQCLFGAFEAGQIAEDVCLAYSTNKNKMRRALDLKMKVREMKEDAPSGLKLNIPEPIEIPPPPPPLPATAASGKS